MRMIERIKEIIFKVKDYDRLESDYCTCLCYFTNDKMSKPNYKIEAVKEVIIDSIGEYLEFLTKEAVKFREHPNFISINKHLTGIDESNMPSKEQIDGVLVAFINRVGMSLCIDYALSYKDFEKEK